MRLQRPLDRVAGIVLGLASVWLFSSDASALRCRHRIISYGDPAPYVYQLCGEAAYVTTRVVTQTQFGYVNGTVAGGGATVGIQIPVEVWVYDFGPNRLMVELLFSDGILVHERTLRYGTNAGRPR